MPKSSIKRQRVGWKVKAVETVMERGIINDIWKNIELEKGLIPHSRGLLIENYPMRLENNRGILF